LGFVFLEVLVCHEPGAKVHWRGGKIWVTVEILPLVAIEWEDFVLAASYY